MLTTHQIGYAVQATHQFILTLRYRGSHTFRNT